MPFRGGPLAAALAAPNPIELVRGKAFAGVDVGVEGRAGVAAGGFGRAALSRCRVLIGNFVLYREREM